VTIPSFKGIASRKYIIEIYRLGPDGVGALIIITMINFFRRILNQPAGEAGKMADDVSCPFF
jgi:hypothetical protein